MANPATVVFFDLGDTLMFVDTAGQDQRFADTLDTLQVLYERGYRIGLLSNQSAGTTVSQVYARIQNLGMAPYIEQELVTISTEIAGNVGKPSQPIFDLARQKASHAVASNDCIFVTETLAHITAARSFSWRAILKRNTGACQPVEGECVAGLSGLLAGLPPLMNLTGTNLSLAPRAKLVDGLWAVPIDIRRVTATLTFDAATSSASGDATMEFTMGQSAGNPVFDLRQTLTAAWLDGVSLPVARLAHHSFGGGANANLRIIESILAAGTVHTLRVTYSLGIPQASTAGSYQPAITWSSGPRLVFNFGFTDLGAGRYLEAWLPANLIFDQYEVQLQLRLLNTVVAHSVISNGTVASLGVNHWQVNFPAQFTALSPLLELRATDTLISATDTVTLPVSGTTVMIEAWKLVSNAVVNLTTQINNIKTYLTANENSTGVYMHGDRFVAFMNIGGMEYDGGTTTGTGALRHETFHSWWARGLKPASQPDAWFDEAWTVYNMAGASESLAFNFTDPAVTLCTQNRWSRVTASGAGNDAYAEGYRFWKGAASLIGVASLNSLMSTFYQTYRQRPTTTTAIEAYLLSRTGNTQLVDAFHRFVYGFANPVTAPDLWLHDDPGHAGPDNWAGRFWDSPDLWVRNSNDGGTTHQSPDYGQDNWLYARVHNRGANAARHFMVSFNVKQFAGTQFTYPNDFLPCLDAAAGFELAPGASMIVKARWPRNQIPAAGNHACLLAAVLTRSDHPVAGRHVWEHNNLAQKNLTIVDLLPNKWIVLPFVVSNLPSRLARSYILELIRPVAYINVKADLLHRSKTVFKRDPAVTLQPFDYTPTATRDAATTQLDCGCHVSGHSEDRGADRNRLLTSDAPELMSRLFTQGFETAFAPGKTAPIPVTIRPQEQLTFGLRLTMPPTVKHGDVLKFDLVQRDIKSRRILGGIAVNVNVR